MDELQARCPALLIGLMRIDDQGKDAWFYHAKGSPVFLGALMGFAAHAVDAELTRQGYR
ncbi:MAG: hypothetical protein KIS92_00960 [Planctomycetota bacterium]|nr:hypothetical protein [Planctomycetota bacterium]